MRKKQTPIVVQMNTRLRDLKVGDLVITAELHRVEAIDEPQRGYRDKGAKTNITVSQVLPRCGVCKGRKCSHHYIKTLGWGQQCIAKVISQ